MAWRGDNPRRIEKSRRLDPFNPSIIAMIQEIPEQIGPFQILSRLGRGGMGTVFSCRNTKTGMRGALKLLSSSLADDGNFRQRFEQEIEALRLLRHPHIVKFLGHGEDNGAYYYVMELLEGGSLEDEIRAGVRFSWQETLTIAIQISSALRCAHDHGIIHRDIKPGNLLRDRDGEIKLSDFGIATLFGNTKLTQNGSVVGTIEYMAPEQATSQPTTVQTDLYSFGAVLTTLLTGKPPFQGKNLMEILHRHANHTPPRPSQKGVLLPVEFDLLIGQLLERDPHSRPRSAFAVLRRLEAIEQETEGWDSSLSVIHPLPMDVLARKILSAADSSPEENPTEGQKDAPEENPDEASLTTLEKDERANAPSAQPSSTSAMQRDTELFESASDEAKSNANSFFYEETTEPPAPKKNPEHVWSSYWIGQLIILFVSAVSIWSVAEVIRHWFTPPAADVLYERICDRADDDEFFYESQRFANDVELFLHCYSRDPRADRVREFESAIRINRTEKQLRMNFRNQHALHRSLTPVERDYLYATRLIITQPKEALKDLEAFTTFYNALVSSPCAQNTEEDVQKFCHFIDVARIQIMRLKKIVQYEESQQDAFIRLARERAEVCRQSDDPELQEQGAEILKAIERLHGTPTAESPADPPLSTPTLE